MGKGFPNGVRLTTFINFIEAKGGFFVGLVVLSLLALRLPQRLLYRSRRQVRGWWPGPSFEGRVTVDSVGAPAFFGVFL